QVFGRRSARHGLDLDARANRQTGGDARSRWPRFGKELRVDRVEEVAVGDARQVHADLDNITESGTGAGQVRLRVLQGLAGFNGDAAGQAARSADAELTRDEDAVTRQPGGRVRVHRRAKARLGRDLLASCDISDTDPARPAVLASSHLAHRARA